MKIAAPSSTCCRTPVARQAFDAVEAGEIELLADERSQFVKGSLPRDHELIYAPLLQQFFDPPARALASARCGHSVCHCRHC